MVAAAVAVAVGVGGVESFTISFATTVIGVIVSFTEGATIVLFDATTVIGSLCSFCGVAAGATDAISLKDKVPVIVGCVRPGGGAERPPVVEACLVPKTGNKLAPLLVVLVVVVLFVVVVDDDSGEMSDNGFFHANLASGTVAGGVGAVVGVGVGGAVFGCENDFCSVNDGG